MSVMNSGTLSSKQGMVVNPGRSSSNPAVF
jgi:hypothetical protein